MTPAGGPVKTVLTRKTTYLVIGAKFMISPVMLDKDGATHNQLGQTAAGHKFIRDMKVQNDELMKPVGSQKLQGTIRKPRKFNRGN